MRRVTPPRATAMRAMAAASAMATVMLAACASTPGVNEDPAQSRTSDDLAWQTQAPGAPTVGSPTDSAAAAHGSTEFWAAVERVESEVADIIGRKIGEDFHALLGKQDTGVALATLASDALGWDLEAGFTPSAKVTSDEAVIASGLEDPASIGEDSADTIRIKTFIRVGIEDAEDFAGALCRTLTEGTRATFIAAVADAADASRTDAESPALAGAGLTTVICPDMADEYLEALRELASMRA